MSVYNPGSDDVLRALDENLRNLKQWFSNLGIRSAVLLDDPRNPKAVTIAFSIDDMLKYILRESTKSVRVNVVTESKVFSFQNGTWASIIIKLPSGNNQVSGVIGK